MGCAVTVLVCMRHNDVQLEKMSLNACSATGLVNIQDVVHSYELYNDWNRILVFVPWYAVHSQYTSKAPNNRLLAPRPAGYGIMLLESVECSELGDEIPQFFASSMLWVFTF